MRFIDRCLQGQPLLSADDEAEINDSRLAGVSSRPQGRGLDMLGIEPETERIEEGMTTNRALGVMAGGGTVLILLCDEG